ncbi:hypothetical protein [Streptomyces sediminimaris]|uniref:hypothetical protein n=1 Tax=Streptomyces sediminimaris TaxID=3383721 RepID=UPI0039995D28
MEHPGIPLDRQTHRYIAGAACQDLADDRDPFTRCRVMAMSAIETDAALFDDRLVRRCADPETARVLSQLYDVERRQQQTLRGLTPKSGPPLEAAIAHEQVAVDLTAWVARMEPDPALQSTFGQALLEDFDHLYRLANLYETSRRQPTGHGAEDLAAALPRHRAPARRPALDGMPVSRHRPAVALSGLHTLTLRVLEVQITHFYVHVGLQHLNPRPRWFDEELGFITEDHLVRQDAAPHSARSWREQLVLREYNECYLYHCFAEQETQPRLRALWEFCLGLELGHLHAACDLMRRQERRDPRGILPPRLPEPLDFAGNRDYLLTLLDADSGCPGADAGLVRTVGRRFEKMRRQVGAGGTPPAAQVAADGHVLFGSSRLFQESERPTPGKRGAPRART